MIAYTVNDAMVKSIARNYPVGEVIFIRGVMTAMLIGAVVLALGHARELRRVVSRPIMLPLGVAMDFRQLASSPRWCT